MSLSVQNIVDSVSEDVRKVLSNSGADATRMIDWVDRIHKDALHTSVYSYLNQVVLTQATTAGTSSYTLSPSPAIRRILSVYDRTFNRTLAPIRQAWPLPQRDQGGVEGAAPPKMPELTQTQWPEYFDLVGTVTFRVFPAPPAAAFQSTLEIYYEGQVTTLSTLTGGTGTLVIPEDGKDMVVAGVNWLALQYLKRPDEAQHWFAVYEKHKMGEVQV